MNKKEHDGSELHRLTPMKEGFDEKLFNKLYKITRPVIRNLVRGIDHKRFNLPPDIITSYFNDKLLFVFNKYYGTCSEEHLQANILKALTIYKNKLLREAYGERAEANQNTSSLEDLFDNSKELEDDSEEVQAKEEHLKRIEDYMREHLTHDAFDIFQLMFNPPDILVPLEDRGKRISNMQFLAFFELPRTKASLKYIAELRQDIDYWINRAREELVY